MAVSSCAWRMTFPPLGNSCRRAARFSSALSSPRWPWGLPRRSCPSQTSDGSFSAVWTATIASKDAFCSIFHNLQDLHPFAPLQSQILQIFRNFFRENFRIFSDFCKILLKFCEISAKNSKFFTQICEIFVKNFEKNAKKIHEVFAENLRSERCKGMQIL